MRKKWLSQIALLCAFVMCLGLSLMPFAPWMFRTEESAQSPARWMISVVGVAIFFFMYYPIRMSLMTFAPKGKIRAIFFNHAELCQSVVGDYDDLQKAQSHVQSVYDTDRVWGKFLYFDEHGERLL